MTPYILTIGLNPVWQKTLALASLEKGEVNRSETYRGSCAGKGLNVARVLCQAGLPVRHITYADAPGGAFFRGLKEEAFPLDLLPTPSPVRGCYTLLDRRTGSATEIVETGEAVPASSQGELEAAFAALLPGASLLILSGSRAAGFSPETYSDMTRTAKEAGKAVILDIRGEELKAALPYRPDLIKPNREEFCRTFLPAEDYRRISDALLGERMAEIGRRQDCSIILTNGAAPTLIYHGERLFERRPAKARGTVNPIGCGDAYTAGLGAEIFRGEPLERALERAEEFAARNALSFIPGDILSGEFSHTQGDSHA